MQKIKKKIIVTIFHVEESNQYDWVITNDVYIDGLDEYCSPKLWDTIDQAKDSADETLFKTNLDLDFEVIREFVV